MTQHSQRKFISRHATFAEADAARKEAALLTGGSFQVRKRPSEFHLIERIPIKR